MTALRIAWRRIPASASFFTGVVTLAALCVYWRTMTPGVTFIDSGELAAVASTLGIAHPSGYPLFTLLGWLFSRLPFGSEEIVRLNFMAVLCCAAAVGVYFRLFRRIALLVVPHAKELRERAGLVGALGGSFLLAFSETYWAEALAVEVYSLQLLLQSVILLLFFRANFPLEREERDERWWHAFAFTVGLGFTNHMTTILLAPGLLYLYFSVQRLTPASWRRLLRLIPAFVAGLSVYIYLPLRAGQSPPLNWGLPVTAERFWWHLSGKQYSVWMFSSFAAGKKQFAYFLSTYGPEFAYAGVALALLGLIVSFRTHRRLAIGLCLIFASSILYAVNYDIHDIDSYFLLAYVCTGLLASVGMAVMYLWLCRNLALRAFPSAMVIVILGLLPLPVHYRSVDQSGNYLVEDYTTNMFSSLPHNAVILSFQWDYWVSASTYFQLVRHVRTDVTVVDQELLRRSWYLKELETRSPWLVAASRPEVDAFLREVDRFERDLPYDGAVIQRTYEAMIASFIRRSMETRPVFVTPEISAEYTRGLNRVSFGLAFELRPDTSFVPVTLPGFSYRPFPGSGNLVNMVPRLYSDACLSHGEYYFRWRRDRAEAQKSLERALLFDHSSQRARMLGAMLRLAN
jgi:hypothetical protein